MRRLGDKGHDLTKMLGYPGGWNRAMDKGSMMQSSDKRIHMPMHPGRFLELEFLEPLGMTAYKLAKDLGVPAPRMYDVVAGKRGISADTALRLARYFGTSAQYWMNLQAHHDLEVEEERLGKAIQKIRPLERTP
jgi:antitoxin HigA-1